MLKNRWRYSPVFLHFRIFERLRIVGFVTIGIVISLTGQFLFGLFEERQIKQDNLLLQQQNQFYQEKLNELKKRINTVEDLSKEIALATDGAIPATAQIAGGPEPVDEATLIGHLSDSTARLESELRDLKINIERKQFAKTSIPQGLPTEGRLTDRFGNRRNPFASGYEYHTGQDIAVGFGTPVRATADGVVIYAAPYAGYGNIVVIDHGNEITTRYGHLSAISARFGEHVKRGDIIGRAGSTGRSTGTHVHYEIRRGNQPLNPLNYLGRSE